MIETVAFLALAALADTTVACVPSAGTVTPLDTMTVTVASSSPGITHRLLVPNGRTWWTGSVHRWAPVAIGLQQLSVESVAPTPGRVLCSLTILVVPPGRLRGGWGGGGGGGGGRGGSALASRLSILLPEARQRGGYGMYSYLLFAAPPDSATSTLYRVVVSEFMRVLPSLEQLQERLGSSSAVRRTINANFLPLSRRPDSTQAVVAGVIQSYDYQRARGMLDLLDGSHFGGPYLVSSRSALDFREAAPREYLVQNLSGVPVHLVPAYVRLFLNQAAQERLGEGWSLQEWTLKLRVALSTIGRAAPEVKGAIDSWQAVSKP